MNGGGRLAHAEDRAGPHPQRPGYRRLVEQIRMAPRADAERLAVAVDPDVATMTAANLRQPRRLRLVLARRLERLVGLQRRERIERRGRGRTRRAARGRCSPSCPTAAARSEAAAAAAARTPPAPPGDAHRPSRRTASLVERSPVITAVPWRDTSWRLWASVARTSPSIVAYAEDEGKSES